jgi:hypothetical protein
MHPPLPTQTHLVIVDAPVVVAVHLDKQLLNLGLGHVVLAQSLPQLVLCDEPAAIGVKAER